ncbi:DUF2330 domain-containing protein [Chondromyces apiculatus]|uniref:DUF2330 domain-containing protein n=1 Tax=Chondromyces apiculatus DSM 436 TaxID=1192034 RepID=A0A017TCI9_9BACT|nr:DUF2330 domain-containing protein [Chondromyces apiculatus]EYF06346.1 Hypothetical protein CAP_1876 [Chondromyces apiculatus DSM 436]
MRGPSASLLLATSLALLHPRPASACAPAYPADAQVRIADEAAIIVWDEASRTEHFIRRASFSTTARDFGFLVPTPSVPQLAEVSPGAFEALEARTAPARVHQTRIDGVTVGMLCALPFTLFLARSLKSAPATASAPPVRVLHEQTVAGYDAAVLEADRADALAEWLRTHGYASRPALETWLQPYVARHWKITAFKIAPRERAEQVATSSVRMSFTTDRPFFPYREPADQRESAPAPPPGQAAPIPAERLLRVFLISRARMEGTLGDGQQPWPGKATWANLLTPSDGPPVTLTDIPVPFEHAWLTAFEDRASPRPGIDDVFFAPAPDPSPVIPEPIVIVDPIEIPIPLDVLVLALGGTAWVWRKSRQRRSDAHAAPAD